MNRKIGWMLGAGLALTAAAAAVLGSCAIDDDVTWITGEQCTGNCRSEDLGAFACDTDSTCTHVEGCTDWDCDDAESPPPPDGGDSSTLDMVSPPDGGETGGADADVGGEDDGGDPGYTCTPDGGGESLEAAQELTLGTELGDRTACPAPSRWYRFSIEAGVRFEVVVRTGSGQQVEFLLYSESGDLVASADMEADAAYSAGARATGIYYLRVRAVGTDPVGYSILVQRLVEG